MINNKMTDKDFQNKRTRLLSKLQRLEEEYVIERAIFMVGDIVKSNKTNIKIVVDEILAIKRYNEGHLKLPVVVYSGRTLTLNGTPRINDGKSRVAEDEIK
jgi:hypothetical protein